MRTENLADQSVAGSLLAWVFFAAVWIVGILGTLSRVSKAWAWPTLAVLGVLWLVGGAAALSLGGVADSIGFCVLGIIGLTAAVLTAVSARRDRNPNAVTVEDLTRRLAAETTSGKHNVVAAGRQDPTGPTLTAEQVRNVAFSKPRIGERGYNENEVDAFLDLVEAALRVPTGRTLTPEQVHNVAFSKPPPGVLGYSDDEVDAFVDLVEQELKHRSPST